MSQILKETSSVIKIWLGGMLCIFMVSTKVKVSLMYFSDEAFFKLLASHLDVFYVGEFINEIIALRGLLGLSIFTKPYILGGVEACGTKCFYVLLSICTFLRASISSSHGGVAERNSRVSIKIIIIPYQ